MRCRVSVEAPVGHHRNGGPYQVCIALTVPGSELVVNHQEDEELSVAIRDAFDAMRRRLEDDVRHQRGAVKVHEEPLHQGQVSKLFPHEGYGRSESGFEEFSAQHFRCPTAPTSLLCSIQATGAPKLRSLTED